MNGLYWCARYQSCVITVDVGLHSLLRADDCIKMSRHGDIRESTVGNKNLQFMIARMNHRMRALALRR